MVKTGAVSLAIICSTVGLRPSGPCALLLLRFLGVSPFTLISGLLQDG